MSEPTPTDQRLDAVRELADEEVPDEAKGVAQGPEGPGGAAGADAPQGGVTGAEAEPEN